MKNATLAMIGGPTGHLARLEDFVGSSIRGVRSPEYVETLGDLPQSAIHDLTRDMHRSGDDERVVYVVYSYKTPIAWVLGKVNEHGQLTRGGDDRSVVVIPDVFYSKSTTKHQDMCRAWLGAQRNFHTWNSEE